MTFNIWNYTRLWVARRQIIADLISAYDPDVVGLQEARHDFRYERGRGQSEQLAEMTGYHCNWALGQVYVPILRIDEGLAILTREEPADVVSLPLSRLPHERGDENQRVCLGVKLKNSDRGFIHVFTTHFSLSPVARVSNAVEVERFIRETAGDDPAVVMGDLNATPAETCIRFLVGDEVVAGRSGKFADCWTVSHPGEPGNTYPSWQPVKRIDYILARHLSGRIKEALILGDKPVDDIYPSDHLAILADLDI